MNQHLQMKIFYVHSGHRPYVIKMTSSCLRKRDKLLRELLFSDKPNTISDDNCWLAIRCELHFLNRQDSKCLNLCSDGTCSQIINKTCPDMINFPSEYTCFWSYVLYLYER